MLVAAPRRANGGLVAQRGELGAREGGRLLGHVVERDVVGEAQLARMHTQNGCAPALVGQRDAHQPVEAAGPRERLEGRCAGGSHAGGSKGKTRAPAAARLVEDVDPVGRRHHDDAVLVRLKAIHTREHLIEGLLNLVVAALRRDTMRRSVGRTRLRAAQSAEGGRWGGEGWQGP